MKTGTVKWFNAEIGYGFIEPDDGGSEVFVHIRAVEPSGMDDLKEGQRPNFEVFTVPARAGRPRWISATLDGPNEGWNRFGRDERDCPVEVTFWAE